MVKKALPLALFILLASCAPKQQEYFHQYTVCQAQPAVCPLNNDPVLYWDAGRGGCVSKKQCDEIQQ